MSLYLTSGTNPQYGGSKIGRFFKKVDKTLKRIKPVTQGAKVLDALGVDEIIPMQYKPAYQGAIETGKRLGYGKRKKKSSKKPGRPRKPGRPKKK